MPRRRISPATTGRAGGTSTEATTNAVHHAADAAGIVQAATSVAAPSEP